MTLTLHRSRWKKREASNVQETLSGHSGYDGDDDDNNDVGEVDYDIDCYDGNNDNNSAKNENGRKQ